jgi:broad specificity phosphatase PhoE
MTQSKVIHASECVTTLDLLRHGATGDDDIFRGTIDLPLSSKGWQQMEKAVGDYHAWTFLVSSPLLRCREFALTLSEKLSIKLLIEPNIKEMNFGRWEGQKPKEVWEKTPEAMRQFWQDADLYPPPEGERLSHFQERVMLGLNETLNHYRGQHGLIVCHGGIIRLIVAHILSMPLQAAMRIQVPYACVTRLHIYHHEAEPDVMSLDFHNGQLK